MRYKSKEIDQSLWSIFFSKVNIKADQQDIVNNDAAFKESYSLKAASLLNNIDVENF